MKIRSLTVEDWADAEKLYDELTNGGSVGSEADFARLVSHSGTMVIGCENGGRIISMVTLHVLPNLTYGGRPYALIENVITAGDYRGRGFGRAAMEAALRSAKEAGCYKVMLLTNTNRGAKGFYEAVGFASDQKWGMIVRF